MREQNNVSRRVWYVEYVWFRNISDIQDKTADVEFIECARGVRYTDTDTNKTSRFNSNGPRLARNTAGDLKCLLRKCGEPREFDIR